MKICLGKDHGFLIKDWWDAKVEMLRIIGPHILYGL
jgi:hypothetical protein